MRWIHKWSEKIDNGFYYSLLQDGFIKPEDQEPDVGPFRAYLDAFSDLSSCRSSGMSLGPIPFTAIVEYFKIYPTGEFEEFHYIIRKMDDVVLKIYSEKNKGVPGGSVKTTSGNKNKS